MQIRENISLQGYHTFGLAVLAKKFASFSNIAELAELLQYASEKSLPTLVLGGGSNLLFLSDYEGLVLQNNLLGIEVIREDGDVVYVKAAAAENWHKLVMYCVDAGFGGMENLALIPGSVGASPIQNIGAYGVEVKDVIEEVEAWHIADGKLEPFTAADCAFGYRESVFKHRYKGRYVITAVTFRLSKKPVLHTEYGAIKQELVAMGVDQPSIKTVAQAVINIRSSKLPDPAQIGNAGSFFKNPLVSEEQFSTLQEAYPAMPHFKADGGQIKVPAGWLIEQCGWKGYHSGDAGCYEKQALVLVNYGAATGKEIYALSEAIVQSVQTKFGIALEREVNII